MGWSRHGRARRGYHHGNLREALVAAALELIAEKGPGGFTFAEAARAAGVSAAAPYRHFRDRDALIADVARRGFERFAETLQTAWEEGPGEEGPGEEGPGEEGPGDPLEALGRVGRAYLAFAHSEPAFYTAMFEAQVPPDFDRELGDAADRAFAVLRRATDALVAGLPEARRPPSLMVSLHVWSLAHGIASLFGRGDHARRKLPMAPEDLLEAGVLVYLRGLGLYGDEKP